MFFVCVFKVCLTTNHSLNARKEWRWWTAHEAASSMRTLSSGRWSPDSVEEQDLTSFLRQVYDPLLSHVSLITSDCGNTKQTVFLNGDVFLCLATGATEEPPTGEPSQRHQLSSPGSQHQGGSGSLWGGHRPADCGHGEGQETGWSSKLYPISHQFIGCKEYLRGALGN